VAALDWSSLSSDLLLPLATLALSEDPLRSDEVATVLQRSGVPPGEGGHWSDGRIKKELVRLFDEGFLEAVGYEWSLLPLEKPRVLAALRAVDPGRLKMLARKLTGDALLHCWDFPTSLLAFSLAVVSEDASLLERAWKKLRTESDDPYSNQVDTVSAGDQTLVGVLLRHALTNGVWKTLAPDQKVWLVGLRASGAIRHGVPARELPSALGEGETDPELRAALTDWEALGLLVAGDLEGAASVASAEKTDTQKGILVLVRWLNGLEAGALSKLDGLLADRARRCQTKAEAFVPGPLFPFLACLALAHGRASTTKIKSWAGDYEPQQTETAKILWSAFRHQGKSDAAELYRDDLAKLHPSSALDRLLMNWGSVWNGLGVGKLPPSPRIVATLDQYLTQEAHWFAAEEARTLERFLENSAPFQALLDQAGRVPGLVRRLADLVDVGSAWETSLKRLADLKFDAAPSAAKNAEQEVLVWLVDPDRAEVEPALRKLLRSGNWSAVKKAPLTRLGKVDHPSIQQDDREALKAIVLGYYGWNIDHKRALEALVGHPRLFLAGSVDTPLVLEAVEIELKVEETSSGLRFRFATALDSDKALLTKVAVDHWQVTIVTEKAKKVAAVVGSGLTVPAAAREQVVAVLGNLAAGIQVRSPLLKENRTAVNLAADAQPILALTPFEEGFSLEVHVRPLGPGTPMLRPGEGPDLVHLTQGDRILTATRDRSAERRAWKAALALCPDLDAWLAGGWSLELGDPLEALTVLAELRDATAALAVEWPQGGRIKLHGRVGAGALKLQVAKDHHWFSVGGTVALDATRIADFRELLNQRTPGRFVRLADGDWVELEAQLLRQLEHLSAVGEITGKSLRIAPLTLAGSELLLDESLTQAEADIDRWRRLWKAGVSPNLGLPASITADLRPYQLDGFRWLARLAEVGAGACLADDMGLGKTLQAIALLSHRASQGPSLVVAPTSVAPNWAAEIRRFDRSLEPVLFSEGSRASRQALVDSLGPGQVLLTTYGLLVTENELLTGRDWNVVVLDEAQAVKNFQSQRTKAVLKLKAGFRLAATGTPLQNHLGELWTLFEFLNPGLLGSKNSFTERFWSPIETKNDEGARRGLQTLVRPFLLRRTKNQVLSELPEKTETTLAVDLDTTEREFYEALRQRALDQMAGLADKNPGEQQILVLTHLMKLRRACCHPVLAGGPDAPSSAKLDQLEELLEGLIDNGHRTLVFSQFTDHLALIRTRLEARGWAYDYLDGSTPAKDRGALVVRFQTGTAPVFLISLQAGGTGLNLTAADYVIHMDPWWNPAVEDQASDRAHRLGQTRPVTIYRLVARDTIEERIVALHRTKRALADALLEGTEAAARLGTDELLELIVGAQG